MRERRNHYAYALVFALGWPTSLAFAATSQVHLYGGYGSLEGRFQDANGEIDMQGWVGVDCPEIGFEPFWQISDFNAENLNSHGAGNHAMWAGRSAAQRPGWSEPPGYGDYWDTVLLWSQPAPTTTAAFDVQLEAVYNHDTEDFYDPTLIEWNQAGVWQSLESIDGRSYDGSWGNFLPPGVALLQQWTVQPEDLVDGEVQIRIRVTSDGIVSDQSGTAGSNPGNSNGAMQVDDITVSFDGVPIDGGGDADGLATFENGDDEGWTPQLDTCSCSVVSELPGDIDPGLDNLTPQVGIFRSASYPGTQGYLCVFTSPAIDWDIPEAQGLDAALVRFRFYCESNEGNCGTSVFVRWRVAGQWQVDSWFLESLSATPTGWHSFQSIITDAVVPPANADAIQLYIRAVAGATESRATVDDVEVVRYDAALTAAPPALSRGHIALDVYPNPTNPSATIRYVLDASAFVRIELFDARGRSVRGLFAGAKPAGTHRVQFDGLDDAGRPVASGVYFVRLRTDAQSSSERVVLVR